MTVRLACAAILVITAQVVFSARWGLESVNYGSMFAPFKGTALQFATCDTLIIAFGGPRSIVGVPDSFHDDMKLHTQPVVFDLRSRTWREVQPWPTAEGPPPAPQISTLLCFGDVVVMVGGAFPTLGSARSDDPNREMNSLPRTAVWTLHTETLQWRRAPGLFVSRPYSDEIKTLFPHIPLAFRRHTMSSGASRMVVDVDAAVAFFPAWLNLGTFGPLIRVIRALSLLEAEATSEWQRSAVHEKVCALVGSRIAVEERENVSIANVSAVPWMDTLLIPIPWYEMNTTQLLGHIAPVCSSWFNADQVSGMIAAAEGEESYGSTCVSEAKRLLTHPRLPPVIWEELDLCRTGQ